MYVHKMTKEWCTIYKLYSVYIFGPADDPLKRALLGLEKHKIRWLVIIRHLVVKFRINSLTYQLNLGIAQKRPFYQSS